jgi:hypothetical protein
MNDRNEEPMTARKTGLTIERHREIGLKLARIADQLATLLTEIANAYPQKSPVYKFAMGPSAPDAKLYALRAGRKPRPMPWDENGFCTRLTCLKHLDDDCQCRGATAERERRNAPEEAAGPQEPRAESARRVPTEPPPIAPHPADRPQRGSYSQRKARAEAPDMGPHPADRDQGDGQDAEPPEALPEIPRFPVKVLIGPLADFVGWGIRDGLHAECVVAAGLAALTTLAGPARG